MIKFLLVFPCNYSHILYCFLDKVRRWFVYRDFFIIHNDPVEKNGCRYFCAVFHNGADLYPISLYKQILQQLLCLLTVQAGYRQTDRRKSDLNSAAFAA